MIKKLLILLLFLGFSFGQDNRENSTDIVMRDGLLYKKNDYFIYGVQKGSSKTSVPYSGEVFTVIKTLGTSKVYGTYVHIEYSVLNGKRHGNYKLWNDDGKPEEEKTYKDGILHGPSKEYYSSGQLLRELIYKDGKKEGPFKEYDWDGQLKSKGIYRNDILHGPFEEYNEGKLEWEGTYKDGKKDGVWIKWSVYTGEMMIEQDWENGKRKKNKGSKNW